jgi:hypothetical protein
MTEKAVTTLEEKIRRDGSLSEERKTALLKLVLTMKPEMKKSHMPQQHTKGMIRSSEHSTNSTIHETEKHKHSRGEHVKETQVVAGEYDNEIDAEIAKGHLKASGIPATIIKDDGGGMLPSLQNTEGVQLLVAEDQSKKARKILQAQSH